MLRHAMRSTPPRKNYETKFHQILRVSIHDRRYLSSFLNSTQAPKVELVRHEVLLFS